MTRSRSAAALAALLLLAPAASAPAGAQALPNHSDSWASHRAGDAAFMAINALVGGVTAGLWQALSDGSFADGFAGGALGGGVAYVGKRLAAETFAGAGFLGRDVAAVGSSIVRNAAEARPLLDSLALPVGPLRLHLSPGRLSPPRVEVDLAELYWTGYGLAEDRLTLQVEESVSSGMPVFRADRPLLGPDGQTALGAAPAGVVFVGPLSGGAADRTLAHERAHALQLDFVHHAWFRPLEEHLARQLPAGGLADRVEYDLTMPVLLWIGSELGWGDPFVAPIEAEAEFLEGL